MAAPLMMIVGVLAVYFPKEIFRGQVLVGSDYATLHQRRMEFAREMFATPGGGSLPGWYPRELMGTPFWSNLQSFPFIPTRLALLLIDPAYAYVYGVALGAMLTAWFTFVFARSVGSSTIASAAAGWTFTCGGFFASRVLSGQLAQIEGYCSLPMLLWLIERCAAGGRITSARLAALALACTCFVLTGHPQMPFYAFVVAGSYLVFRTWRRWRELIFIGGAMFFGVGIGSFALLPMTLLIGRSTRVLHLAQATNDIPMPYGRLKTFLFPWSDGWPQMVNRSPHVPFTGYPTQASFWDTVCYVGWVPVVAVLILVVWKLLRSRRVPALAIFFALVGVVALITSLPFFRQLTSHIPGTFVRSPSRQVYIIDFVLALALAAAIDCIWKWRAGILVIAFLLLGHVVDVSLHARAFVATTAPTKPSPQMLDQLSTFLGDARAGVDVGVISSYNRQIDDVGFYDSIMLAKSYRAVMDLSDQPPGLNVESFDGSEMPRRALEACGVKLVVTPRERRDLIPITGSRLARMYQVPSPQARALFFPETQVQILTNEEIHRRLRQQDFDLRSTVMFESVPNSIPLSGSTPNPATVAYWRSSPDVIEVDVTAPAPGYACVLESYDPGWSATIDAKPVEILPGNDVFLAARVSAGQHQLRFAFHTPGARAGMIISLISAVALAIWTAIASRAEKRSRQAGATL
jgi:hypothetical protein